MHETWAHVEELNKHRAEGAEPRSNPNAEGPRTSKRPRGRTRRARGTYTKRHPEFG